VANTNSYTFELLPQMNNDARQYQNDNQTHRNRNQKHPHKSPVLPGDDILQIPVTRGKGAAHLHDTIRLADGALV